MIDQQTSAQNRTEPADGENLPAMLAGLANARRARVWENMRDELQAQGSFASPSGQTGDWTSGIAGLRAVAFYSRVFAAVWRSNRLLRRLERENYAFDRQSRILTHGHEGRAVLRAAELAGAALQVSGAQYLPTDGTGAIIVGNHMSSLETMALAPVILPFCDLAYVAKDSLLKYPVFGRVLTGLDSVIVTRTNPRDDLRTVLGKGAEVVNSGRVLIIFPQTTRSAVFDPSQFSSLPIKLAKRTKVPLIPLALTTDVWGTGRMIKDLGPINPGNPVRFAFGPPIVVEDEKQAQQQLVAFIADQLRSWGKRVVEPQKP